ncbi:MAG: cobalt-precorrin 5A hydrolase [Clostridia bacterium]|nr:cobalt-precorrin 5A hydrolase [Clostridia bacterium]
MRAALFAYSKKGLVTAKKAAACIECEAEIFTAERLAGDGAKPIIKPSSELYGECFSSCEALVFVSSCGIAVRCIAPFVKSKTTDPAVVVIDETGRFVISLLSGHIGGANALAKRIADALGAVPVVTTATDANGRFPVDAWAETHGFAISDMAAAKAVSAAILEGDIPIKSDFPITGELPAGLTCGEGTTGVYVTYRTDKPFKTTLRLVPECVALGIGCRRGTPKEAIAEAVRHALAKYGVDPRAVKCAASIDLKKDEAGLIEYCRENGLPLSFYPAEELKAVPGEFTASDFVKEITGVDCVCERAALINADELIIRKTALAGVTVAAALVKTEVNFG